MSRPIYPDDEITRLAGVTRRASQLERRPVVGGGGFSPSDCYVEQATGVTLAPATVNMPWDVFWRSSSIWSTGPDDSTPNNDASGDDYVHCSEAGLFLVHAWVSGYSPAWTDGMINVTTPADVLTTSRYSIPSYAAANNGEVFLTMVAHANDPPYFSLVLSIDDALSHDFLATMSVARIGDATIAQVY